MRSFPAVHSHRLHRRGGGFGTGPDPFAALLLRGDLARYREFQAGMARMTVWMGNFNASAERAAAFTRANRAAGERVGVMLRALGWRPRG